MPESWLVFRAPLNQQEPGHEADELLRRYDAMTTKFINPSGQLNVSLTDTLVLVRIYRQSWCQAFKSTLEESKNVDLLVHVDDAW